MIPTTPTAPTGPKSPFSPLLDSTNKNKENKTELRSESAKQLAPLLPKNENSASKTLPTNTVEGKVEPEGLTKVVIPAEEAVKSFPRYVAKYKFQGQKVYRGANLIGKRLNI